ncbi:MAG: SO_0444 family Cu/Zn efflux transporter [Phycisphaerales bacterium]
MPDWMSRFADELWMILLDSGVWLIVGFALAGVVHALVPMGWIRKQLGGRGVIPIAKAAALGLPMPLCSCSVIPVAASLRQAGAGKGASAAFTISTPQTGEESIPLTWALFGPVFAIARPIIAIVTAFVAGVAIDRIAPDTPRSEQDRGERGDDAEAGSCCSEPRASARADAAGSCCAHEGDDDTPALGARVLKALKYGFVTLPADLAPWLITGLVLAAVVASAVPEGWIGEHLGSGIVPMLLALVVGVPLYICATSSTPLAFALVTAGMSPGAALVLLLAGPATNTATMAWVIKDLGKRALAVYLVVIALFALASGLAFDAFLSGAIDLASGDDRHEHIVGVLAPIGAVALSVLMVVALALRVLPSVRTGRHDEHHGSGDHDHA